MANSKLSVIITNYNYAKFVGFAIESLLTQSVPMEIIVVDDCSSDESRTILSAYMDRVTTIFKNVNLGHGDGFNQGFAASTGDLILFLDADDFMLPGAAQTILESFDASSALNVYRMHYADPEGNTYGVFPPLEAPLTHGDATDILISNGSIRTTVTSGMIYPRWALEQVFPVPAEAFRQGADGYLASAVPLYGPIKVHTLLTTAYRLHTTQHSKFLREYASRARWCIAHNAARYAAICDHAAKLGLQQPMNLADSDIDNVQQRLISLLFDPEAHPIPSDRLGDLTCKIIELLRAQDGGPSRLVKILYWNCFSLANEKMRKLLISWQVDPLSRPAWLASMGRFIRTRFKITP